MTELLPILFQRGQDESIDPRVAPLDVHAVAQNVRWRKDGRPAKRYGSAAVSMAGFEQNGSQYTTQPPNAITSWQGQPLLAVGTGVAMLGGTQWGQRASAGVTTTAVDIAHWKPGTRNTIIRPEIYALSSLSIAQSSGVVLSAWVGAGLLHIAARTLGGAVLVQPLSVPSVAADSARCVSVPGGRYIYVIFSSVTLLRLLVFDTSTLTVVVSTLDTVLGGGFGFDAIGRSADFLVSYQITATAVRTRRYSAVAAPAQIGAQLDFTTPSSSATKVGVAGTSSSLIYVGFLQDAGSGGAVGYQAFNNALSATAGPVVIVSTSSAYLDQPAIMIDSATTALMTWGGAQASTNVGFFAWAKITASSVTASSLGDLGLRPASKPFAGPAVATLGATDSYYIWTHTAQSAANQKWDDQRGYYLIQIGGGAPGANEHRRMMHVPNITASAGPCQAHMADVYDAGLGYGFGTALVSTLRFGSGAAEDYGAEWVTFRSSFESPRQAATDFAEAGRAIQFAGGVLTEWNGSVEETGFTNVPVIVSLTASAGGSLSAGNYIYVAVYEYIDAQGRRHRSAPSDPVSITVTATQKVTVVAQPLVADSRLIVDSAPVLLHVYRTLVGQSTFRRVTPNIGAPGASFSLISFVDTMADTAAAAAEDIYTDGGVVANTLPPPSTFMCVCNARLWLAGQLDANVITASKILVDGEPTQFSDELEFSVFLPQACTGIASIDGTVVAFARERIYFVTGDGPSDQGIGSFNPPVELPTDVGCIDWRSVVETSQGVFFQSKRGIYLLPRGFNTPIFVGAPVEATLASYPIVQSATLVSQPSNGANSLGEITVRFVVASDELGSATRVLVYDPRTQGWSVDSRTDSFNVHGIGGTWLDSFVYTIQQGLGTFVGLQQETVGAYDDGIAPLDFISSTLATGDIRPFGVAGYGAFENVVVVGEYRGPAVVTVSASVDGQPPSIYSFTVTGPDGTADNNVYLQVTPRVRLGSSLKVSVVDNAVGVSSAFTEGFIAQALFVEHETLGKTKRLAAARKA